MNGKNLSRQSIKLTRNLRKERKGEQNEN